MKSAILIMEGVKQFILTPETEEEEKILQVFKENENDISIFHGSRFHLDKCQGGWYRQYSDSSVNDAKEKSVILLIEKKSSPES